MKNSVNRRTIQSVYFGKAFFGETEVSSLAINRVNPGDLITANLLNQIIDEINQLSEAVASLERKRRPGRQKQKGRPKRSKARG